MFVRSVRWPVLIAACLALAACGTEEATVPAEDPGSSTTELPVSSPIDPPVSSTVDDPATAGPADLIGTWMVSAASETGSVTLEMLDQQLTIDRSCGHQMGEWRAGVTGLFIASVSSWEPSCPDGSTAPEWLSDARFFAIEDDGAALLDADGATTATLSVATDAASPGPSAGSPVPEDIRERLNASPAPPAGLGPITREQLVGRWVPADGSGAGAPTQPFAELRADGSWTGSDGCNGQGGRWTADDDGQLLATVGEQTVMGCDDMVDVGLWVRSAVLAGLDGDIIVLIGADGQETGRLVAG